MAVDAILNLWPILVENVFGGAALACFGMAAILLLILFICRASWMFCVFWIAFYTIAIGSIFGGGIVLVLGFFISFLYCGMAIVRWWFKQTG